MSGMTLHEIGEQFATLETALIDSGGELTPEIEALLADLQLAEKTKVDNYRHVVLRFEKFAGMCDDEIHVLQDKATAARQSARRLKEWLKLYMEQRQTTKLEGELFTASIQKNGGMPPVTVFVPVESLDRSLCRIKVEPDTDAIRGVADEQGNVVGEDGTVLARVEPRGTHLRFR